MEQENAKLLAAIFAGLFMLARGCAVPAPEPVDPQPAPQPVDPEPAPPQPVPPRPEPPPPPVPPEPASEVRQCFEDYRLLMSGVWTEGAALSFPTDKEADEWIKLRHEAAHTAAFQPLYDREQREFGNPYSDDNRKALWREFARGAK